MTERQIAHVANDCVEYILLNRYPDGQIEKSAIIKQCIVHKDIPFQKVYARVQNTLKTQYGIELVKCTPLGTKFQIQSLLPYLPNVTPEPDPNDLYRDTALYMILCNILLDHGSSTYESIEKLLNGINFDVTKLDTENDLQKFIMKNFVQKNYLLHDAKENTFQWSPMSMKLYDKTECLKVACEIVNVPLSTYQDSQIEDDD